MKKYNVAILGATGAVGTEFLKLIEERNFPFNELRLLASKRSAGKVLKVCGKDYTVEEATKDSFKDIDIALFAGGSISKEFAPYAVQAGAVVIDNSSAFRMDLDVPLIVPEVNPEAILGHKGIIANPNCSTIIMCMALKPLYDLAKIKRVVVSTYQAVSGAGKEGIEELERQVGEYVAGKPMTAELLPTGSMPKHYPIAFNLIPQIDIFLEDLYTKEELKMVNETQKIFNDKDLKVSATCVRVPVYRSHSESVNIEFEHDLDLAEMRKALATFPGVQVLDDTVKQEYPMPLYTSEKNDCFVGRLRRDDTRPNTFNLWVVGDQIRKGAALNTLQIAEVMIKNQWI